MSRFGLTAKVDTQKQVVTVNPVNNINVNVRSPSDIQNGDKERETPTLSPKIIYIFPLTYLL